MSIKYILSAMEAKVGSSSRKLVLIKLADNANDSGECFPSYETVSRHCEMSKRSVMSHIKSLQDDGFLTICNRKNSTGFTSNKYKLNLDRMAGKPSENSALGSENSALGSENSALGSENSALPPSENFSPRICQSFEPVTEPVTEPKENPPHKKTKTEIDAEEISNHLAIKIFSRNSKARFNPKSSIDDIEKAIRIDGRTKAEMIGVIDWIYTGDEFWVPNIMSGKKLREKFDTLFLQKNKPTSKNQKLSQVREIPDYDDIGNNNGITINSTARLV